MMGDNCGYSFWCDYINFGKPIGDYICSSTSIVVPDCNYPFIIECLQCPSKELTN